MDKINLIGLKRNSVGRLFDQKINGSLILSYSIDLIFYENWILKKFLDLGSANNLIFVDINQLLQSQNNQGNFLRNDSSSYIFQGVNLNNIFHPKIILLTGDKETRMFIGSGNLTVSGLSNNREIYSEFSTENPEGRFIINEFYQYFQKLLIIINPSDYIRERLLKIFLREDFKNTNEDSIHNNFRFLHNLEDPILNQIIPSINNIENIYVVSPFYDQDLHTVQVLNNLVKNKIKIFFQKDFTNFPISKVNSEYDIYSYPKNSENDGNLHAKMVIFEYRDRFDLLYGSPNLTKAALLSTYKNGNSETAIFCRNLNKDLLNNYIPEKFSYIKSKDITLFNYENIQQIEFLIKSAVLKRNGNLEISLGRNFNNNEQFDIYLDGIKIEKSASVYIVDTNLIKVSGIYELDRVAKLHLIINDKKTNVVIVLNEQKGVSNLLSKETKIFNSLKNLLQTDSFEMLRLARSFDLFVEISEIESTKYITKEGHLSGDEEAVELEIEKDSIDYYIKAEDIVFKEGFAYEEKSSYVFDLFNLVSCYKKLDKDFKDQNIDRIYAKNAKGIENIDKDYYDSTNYKRFIKKITDTAINLSSVYKRAKNNELSELESLYCVINSSIFIPLFDLITFGIILKNVNEECYIALLDSEIREILIPVLEILNSYWSCLNHFNDLTLNKFKKKQISDFFVLTIFNICLTEQLVKRNKGQINIMLNNQKYTYLYSNLIMLLADFYKFLEADENSVINNVYENKAYQLIQPAFDKFEFKSSPKDVLVNYFKVLKIIRDQKNRNMRIELMKVMNNQKEFSVFESVKQLLKTIDFQQ